jgi:benzoyl-CoA reductase subunit D
MNLTMGIDVGSSTVKCLIARSDAGRNGEILARRADRIRRRDPDAVVEDSVAGALRETRITRSELDYVATTGEGDWIDFRTGHFYGMTTHARGALELDAEARGVLDVGGLHARAILMDERSKVLGYRMTSQCASGSGQFLENISRYLGCSLAEVGQLSLQSKEPEQPSGICAVLAETDVINMVSRGIRTSDILKGIHLSMAGRYARLLRAAGVQGVLLMTGGLALDVGLVAALREELERQEIAIDLRTHPDSIYAGALGAALWGAFRVDKLARTGAA